ncbi:hypothetical protein [Peribacillus acanthi]|uniref:hypothetical protein n=1 Tax=Peribacillus acanthi TaxID=2171554 RepID=UPI000D3E22F3|nr:hypothetical protein [Peribacillus acanthi]
MTFKNRKASVSFLYGAMFSQKPMEKAVIDHICLDIEVICPVTKNYLGRPWLTLLIDVYSRRVLAYYLSIEPPSYVSIMMTLRESVRKNSMIPKTLLKCDAKRFQSENLDKLIVALDIKSKLFQKMNFQFTRDC